MVVTLSIYAHVFEQDDQAAAERVAGARRLLARQAAMLLLQILFVLAGAALAIRG